MGRYQQWIDEPARVDVTGKGDFPMDMLRHDLAYPADTESAMLIAPEKDNRFYKDPRTIRLCLHSRRHFTPDRWASFGWIAEDQDPHGYYTEEGDVT